jgi:hypothetical protein
MKRQIALVFFSFLFLSSLLLVRAQTSNLTLSVVADKEDYCGFSAVTISGNLLKNNAPVNGGLVALQIQDSTGNTLVVRTLKTGTSDPVSLAARISSAFLSDQSEHQLSSIQVGLLGYFTINIVNNLNIPQSMLITVNLFDSAGIPIGQISEPGSLMASQAVGAILSLQIPSWAHSGIAYGYANIYTDWPSNGGVPLGPEQSFQFTIAGGQNSISDVYNSNYSQGPYSLTFRLPVNGLSGNYSVVASSSYSGITVLNSTSFRAQFADFYKDGVLNSQDFFFFANSFIEYSAGHNDYSSLCDLNQDEKINSADFFLFVDCYMTYWSAQQ